MAGGKSLVEQRTAEQRLVTPKQFQRAMALFDEALAQPAAERRSWLDRRVADDPLVRAEVEALLAEEANPPFSDAQLDGGGMRMLESMAIRHAPERIGQYEVIREIDEGGMGIVYEARQDHPQRRVAIKVMRPGVTSRALVRRFTLEAQTLGLLDHPGVANVYDAGATDHDGAVSPYIVMEYIDGKRLDVHARDHKLTRDERLELVARVCDAVQHAHQKGVVHRDLKPANVLVKQASPTGGGSVSDGHAALSDRIGQPKILDFGIARVLDAKAHVTLHTQTGQILGTLSYMSPEQVAARSDTDARCDVYALGVILFQLLTDRLPIDVTGMSLVEAARLIGEANPISAGTLDRALRGDVETIIAKTLEKDPDRRYPSAAELAADLRRCLSHEPVLARPATTFYRLRKFARRNKALVGGLTATFAALVVGLTGTIYFLADAIEQRNAVEATNVRLEATNTELSAVINFQFYLLAGLSSRDVGVNLRNKLRQEFERGLEKGNVEEAARAEALLDFDRMLAFVNATNLARDLLGEVLAARSLEEVEREHTDNPTTEGRLRAAVGAIYQGLGMNREALGQMRRAAELVEPLLATEDHVGRNVWFDLAKLQKATGDHAAAEVTYRRLLGVSRRFLGESSIRVFDALNGIGQSLHRQRRFDEAVEFLEGALEHALKYLGPEDSKTMSARNNLAILQSDRGEVDAALEQLRAVLDVRQRTQGRAHQATILALNNMLGTLFKSGRIAEAETYALQAVEAYAEARGDEHPRTLMARNNLGRIVIDLGRPAEAEKIFREAYNVATENLSPTNEVRDKCTSNLIDALLALRRSKEAAALCHEHLGIRRAFDPPLPVLVAQTLEQLGHACLQTSRFEAARDAWQECVSLREKVSSDHWLTHRARSELGEALTALGEFEAAEQLLLGSAKALVAKRDMLPPVAGAGCVEDARARLVSLYEVWNKPTEAARWRDRSAPDAVPSP